MDCNGKEVSYLNFSYAPENGFGHLYNIHGLLAPQILTLDKDYVVISWISERSLLVYFEHCLYTYDVYDEKLFHYLKNLDVQEICITGSWYSFNVRILEDDSSIKLKYFRILESHHDVSMSLLFRICSAIQCDCPDILFGVDRETRLNLAKMLPEKWYHKNYYFYSDFMELSPFQIVYLINFYRNQEILEITMLSEEEKILENALKIPFSR
jgi:hypothetical protein